MYTVLVLNNLIAIGRQKHSIKIRMFFNILVTFKATIQLVAFLYL
jgi:hypothetical protein